MAGLEEDTAAGAQQAHLTAQQAHPKAGLGVADAFVTGVSDSRRQKAAAVASCAASLRVPASRLISLIKTRAQTLNWERDWSRRRSVVEGLSSHSRVPR